VALLQDDWDRHWDDLAGAATINPAQLLRRRVIRSQLRLGDRPARVLDIGSGQGDLVAELRLRHPEVELCGIDYSQSGVDIAAGKVTTATFLRWDLLEAADPPQHLSAWATHAVCSEVLEHVDDPATLMSNARKFLAPGCRVVVTVPGGPMSAFDRYIGHRRHFSSDDLRGLLQSVGFEVETATGVGFPFFNLYRLVVIMRGERLVRDVARREGGSASRSARAVMGAFRVLFALNPPRSPWGWQVVGVARMPGHLEQPSG
jgi:SAM-dependent methyltransferase